MLSPRALLPVVAVLCLTGCQRSTEAKLIGTWDLPVQGATNRVTYKADHTCFTAMSGVITLAGQWRVQGNQLVTKYKNEEVKATIVKITSDELKLQFSGSDAVYTWRYIK